MKFNGCLDWGYNPDEVYKCKKKSRYSPYDHSIKCWSTIDELKMYCNFTVDNCFKIFQDCQEIICPGYNLCDCVAVARLMY